MFGKKILGLVTLLFACGLNSVNAERVSISTCADEQIADACVSDNIQTATNICIKDNVIYSYAGSVGSCYQAKLLDETNLKDDTFHILRIGAATAGRLDTFNDEISNPGELAILKCANGKCAHAYGIIKSGSNYYKIGKSESGSDSAAPGDSLAACTGTGDIGKLVTVSGSDYICLASGKGAILPARDDDNNTYLLKGKANIASGAFKDVNLGSTENHGIVIIGQNAVDTEGSQTPSMLVFDPTYESVNDCIEADFSISNRIDNLCTVGAECDYYFCNTGICEQSTSVDPEERQYEESLCKDPTGTDDNCTGLQKVGTKYYNCSNGHVCTELTETGYFLNKDTGATNAYIKCFVEGTTLKCNEYVIDAEVDTCGEAGNGGLFVSGGVIKLCLDSASTGISLVLDASEDTPIDYFVSLNGAANNIFGAQKDGYYVSVTVTSGEVVLTENIDSSNKSYWYKYADGNNKILTKTMALDGDSTSICSTAKNSIVEFKIEVENNVNVEDSTYYTKSE